jgi:ATP-dependent Clp endopeptidase proteolytic subunit ClpP
LAALPPGLSAVGADADELIGNDQGAILDPAEARKLLRLLGQYAGTTQPSAHTGRRVTAARLRPTSLFTSAGRSRRLLNRADVKPRPTRADGQRWYRITNTAAGPTEVMIYDEIGLFGVSAAALVSDLKAITGDQIALHINSPGGEVFDGIAIYNALKAHRAAVTVHIDGLAASAASFIAQAGDRVLISRNAQMMIHDGLAVCVGNAADMQETAKLLDRCSDNIADIYAQRAGGTVADWRARMRAETWYTAQEAVDAGLADEVAQQPARDGDATLVVASWDLSVFRYPGRTAAPGPRNAAPAGAMGCDTCDTAASDDQVPDDHYEQMLTDLLVDLDDDQVRELAELAEAMVAANPDATTGPAARASAPVNEHIGFNALKARLAAKGAHNPGGLAAYIGRKKYGRAGMAAKAAAGRAAHKATDHTGPVPLFEFNPDDFRTAVAAIRPAEPVFDPDLFRAAVQVVATDAPAVPDPTPPAPPEDPPITIDPAAFRRALREGRL